MDDNITLLNIGNCHRHLIHIFATISHVEHININNLARIGVVAYPLTGDILDSHAIHRQTNSVAARTEIEIDTLHHGVILLYTFILFCFIYFLLEFSLQLIKTLINFISGSDRIPSPINLMITKLIQAGNI